MKLFPGEKGTEEGKRQRANSSMPRTIKKCMNDLPKTHIQREACLSRV